MSMTIVDALKAKGSTGGNTIMEAIENLPGRGSGGVYIINSKDDGHERTLNKTWQEVYDAWRSGQFCIIVKDESQEGVTSITECSIDLVYYTETSSEFEYGVNTRNESYYCTSRDAYPVS